MMAKRNNNSRSKKFQASKPYDISNSFVKKVASRVTELLPQSLWPTNWFSSTTGDGCSPGDGRKLLNSPLVRSNSDTNEEVVSPRTAWIPLDSNVNDPLFDASISTTDFKGRRLKNSIITSSEDAEDGEAVAGPSGISRKISVGKTISGKPNARDGFCYNARRLEVNGEDHSDSSESTSGCSSLPQMDSNVDVRNTNQTMTDEIQSSCPQPVTRPGAKRRRQEEPLYSSMNTSALLPSLESFSSPGRTVPVGRRRNPSFNPDIFGPQSWGGEKTNIKDRIVNSPFYSGRTTYGGVSAYQNHLNRSSIQESSGLRSIRVQPVKTAEAKGDAAMGMSNTARRILEALEMFSSPIQDAKKIPLSGSINIKRRKILTNMDSTQLPANSPSSSAISVVASNSLGDFSPTVKELMVPTVPDILALRRRQKLQGSTVAAREVANDTNVLPFGGTEKPSDNVGYWTSEKSGGGKIRSKKEIDEETVEKPNLPNVSLPITSLPKFDLILSTDLPSHSQTQTNSFSKFKFSSPIAVTSVSGSLATSNKFTFSSPQKATERDNCRSNDPRTDILKTAESVQNKSEDVNKVIDGGKTARKNLETEKLGKRCLGGGSSYQYSSEDLPQSKAQCSPINSDVLLSSKEFSGRNTQTEKTISVTNSSKSEKSVSLKNSQVSLSLGSEESKNVKEKFDSPKLTNSMADTKSGFGDKFKPPSGSWSCDVCMISNPSDKSKCLACETPRPGFGDKFKPPSGSWSCDVCMISNPSDKSKCLACETPRKSSGPPPVSGEIKSTSSGFGDQFKKAEGTWDCTICLVRNKAGGPPKCVACEAPKPGSESVSAKSESTSSNKLSMSSSGFQFGIDKAGNPPKTTAETKPSFTFGSSSSTASVPALGGTSASGFTFGVKPEAEKSTSGFTFGVKPEAEKSTSGFTFGVKPEAEKSTSGFTFGVKPEAEKSTSGFTFGIPTTKENSEVDGAKKPMVSKTSSLFGSNESQINKFSSSEPNKSPLATGRVEITVTSETTTLKAEDNKFGGTNASTVLSEEKVSFKSSDENMKVNAPTSSSSESNAKQAFSFVAPEGKSNSSTPIKDTSLSNGKWKVDAKSSSNVTTSSPALFSTSTAGPGWSFTLPTNTTQSSPFSSPKPSFFPQSSSSPSSVTSDSTKKQEETIKPPAAEVKFGDGSLGGKFFGIPASKDKSQEVPTTSSSGIKFEELPKQSSPFSLDGKISTTSSLKTSIASNPISTNAFKSTPPVESISEKALASSEKPSVIPAPSFGSNPITSKSSSSGPVFMFRSGTGSTGSGFNLTGQKPFAQAAKDEPPKLFSNIGTSSGGFNLGKTPAFGAATSSPSLVTSASTLPAPETKPVVGSLFATPTSNTVFGASATTSVTASSSSTTTAVSTAPSAFAPSIFNQPFPPVSTPSVSFGSQSSGSSAFGTSSSVFRTNTTPSANPFSFSGSAKPAAEEQPAQPAPFAFASSSNQPFTFGASSNKPAFSFVDSNQPITGTSGQATALPSAPAMGGFSFSDASKGSSPFGAVQPSTSVGGGTSNPFGTSAPNPPTFGATSMGETNPPVTAAFGTTPFNFGSAQSNPSFSFGASQSTTMQQSLSQPSGFNFGQVSQPTSAPQPVAPQFNPNLPPSFNFTNGATPQFTATPAGLSVPPSANTMQRRFKKAVRRSTQPR